jgi:diguanylate cyclase (GGDEF)-like protein
VDPDPVNPGEIGEEVVVTDALIKAGSGTASVDTEPAQDEWGNFYSSYSPVFDSEGNVAAIVGVDFDANWYEAQVREHMKPAIIIIMFFVFLCALIVFTFSRRMLLRVRLLNSQLSEMAVNVDELITQLSTEEHIMLDANPEMYTGINESHSEFSGEGDEIDMLSSRLQDMQEEISLYKSFAHARACTDALTGVRNTTAYTEIKESINRKIEAGNADFAIIIFDINYLKKINDQYGHAAGDEVIRGAGHMIAETFGPFATFRVGGDEFLVLEESITEEEIKAKLEKLEGLLAVFNKDRVSGMLSLSSGYAFFRPEEDHSVREVFIRADEAMYCNKEIMHRSL